MMPGLTYSRRAWCYIAVIPALGAGLELLLLRREWPLAERSGATPTFPMAVAVFVAVTVAGLFPVKLDRDQKMSLGTAAEFAGALLLIPSIAVAASVGATLAYSVIRRRPWFNVMFSCGQHALVVGGAAVTYGTFWSPLRPPLTTAAAAAAALGAAVVYASLAITIVSGVVAATQRRRLVECLRSLSSQSGAQYAALLGAGALISVSIWSAPWATPLPALILPLIQQLNRTLERLAVAKEQVEDALARQRRFVSDVAHEIGTPLTTVAGNLEVLRRAGADDLQELRETLDDVASEFGRLATTFSQLLLLAEADEHELIVRRPIRLDLLLGDVIDVWEQILGERGLALERESFEPVEIEGDEERLRYLFGELLENASRYTPRGGRIRLLLRRDARGARVVVADTGIGISAEDLPHIFDRFYRGRSAQLLSPSRPMRGSGLGLAIVRWIVESHGGQILVASTVGQGSTFTVELPLMESRKPVD